MNIGWERISYKEYIRPKQCFKSCKFGHLAKHCKEEKDLRTNCRSSEHTWKDCKASPKCINYQLWPITTPSPILKAATSTWETPEQLWRFSITLLLNDNDSFSLNELYSFENNITNISKAYKIAAYHSAPKAVIAIKTSFNSQAIHITKEVVVILANIYSTDLLLASIYCPPNNIEENLNTLRPILNKYNDFPMIILGDFNAKSRVWGQRNLGDRGSKLLPFCNQQDLNIENSPDSLPSFTSTRGESWIDLL
ncbi:uncharacterized protein CDAR_617071 [Caerostris darwini]|uniref:Endonuclease/exonuclease/phosphatase domain-containing protein n=1 Tax=Caerostris darwini TaxID=1538125 RepID=A0AAV4NVV3_9ARAC|nr:uncharacterized protein CDAR_617071 [Caerostris darwini]